MLKVQSEMKNIPTINLDNKGLLHWLYLHSIGIVCVVKGGVRSLAEREKTNAGDKNMSTHAAIGIAQADGTIKAIYLHNDGYPSFAGAILAGWYNTVEKAEALIALGALSGIGEKIEPDPNKPHTYENWQEDVVFAYHRDRGDELRPGNIYKNKEHYQQAAKEDFWADYLYLFRDGKWFFYGFKIRDEWFRLETIICKQN